MVQSPRSARTTPLQKRSWRRSITWVDASAPQAHSARPLDRWRDRQSRGLLWPRCPAKPRSVLQASSAAFGDDPFNDDCGRLNDILIWAFSRIRANCPSHSAKTKSLDYLWTRDPRYWRVISVTVLLLHKLAARSFPGWARPRAKRARRSPTAIITGRWPGSCPNWRARRYRPACTASSSISPGATSAAPIFSTPGYGRTFQRR